MVSEFYASDQRLKGLVGKAIAEAWLYCDNIDDVWDVVSEEVEKQIRLATDDRDGKDHYHYGKGEDHYHWCNSSL